MEMKVILTRGLIIEMPKQQQQWQATKKDPKKENYESQMGSGLRMSRGEIADLYGGKSVVSF